jgi:hypothetical protein
MFSAHNKGINNTTVANLNEENLLQEAEFQDGSLP